MYGDYDGPVVGSAMEAEDSSEIDLELEESWVGSIIRATPSSHLLVTFSSSDTVVPSKMSIASSETVSVKWKELLVVKGMGANNTKWKEKECKRCS